MTDIRDRRHAAWFWMDKSIMDDYGPHLGAYGIAVYALLARHADNKGQAFPSLLKIAKALRLSRQSIVRTLESLVTEGLIEKSFRTSEHGDATTNVYTLLQVRGTSPQDVPTSPQDVPPSPQDVQVRPHRTYPTSPQDVPTSFLTRSIEQDPLEQEENYLHLGSEDSAVVETSSTTALPSDTVGKMATPPTKKKRTPIPWPKDDPDEKAFGEWIARQDVLREIMPPVGYAWWCTMSRVINGLPSPDWLECEYAKMEMWLQENPKRKPTPRGTSAFVRNWLDKAYTYERRQRVPTPDKKEIHIHYDSNTGPRRR